MSFEVERESGAVLLRFVRYPSRFFLWVSTLLLLQQCPIEDTRPGGARGAYDFVY